MRRTLGEMALAHLLRRAPSIEVAQPLVVVPGQGCTSFFLQFRNTLCEYNDGHRSPVHKTVVVYQGKYMNLSKNERLALLTCLLSGLLAAPLAMAVDPPIPTPIVGPSADSENMTFLSQLIPSELGVVSDPIWDEYSLSDIWGWVSPNGEEYALIGTIDGLSIVRVTDPQHPEFMGLIPTVVPGDRRLWRDVQIYNRPDGDDPPGPAEAPYTGFVYMTTEARVEGIIIFELNALDAMAAAPNSSHTLEPDAVWANGGYESAHNIAINQESGYGYLTGVHLENGDNACGDADPTKRFNTLIVNLAANPTNPPVVACLQNTGEHDMYVVNYNGPDKDYTNHEIAFVFDGRERNSAGQTSTDVGYGGLTLIWDVTDKNDIKVISSFNVPGVCYSHQGWTTKNNEFLLINDEVIDSGSNNLCPNLTPNDHPGLVIVNITDLDAPYFSKRVELDYVGNAHNFMVVNRHLYWAGYSGGARVLELKRTKKGNTLGLDVVEVAHMDTEPRDAPNYFGLWGLYKFEKSGTLIGSDVVNGLVVMKVN